MFGHFSALCMKGINFSSGYENWTNWKVLCVSVPFQLKLLMNMKVVTLLVFKLNFLYVDSPFNHMSS